jgi:hypothetical protein
MMIPKRFFPLAILMISGLNANAAEFAGDYHAQTEDGALRLTLSAAAVGRYTGVFSLEGYDMPVTAAIRGDKLQGEISDGDESYAFEATELDGRLNLAFAAGDYLVLERGSPPQATDNSDAANSAGISVNGVPLTTQQQQQLADYGLQAQPGNYWYDPASGAWGIWGGPLAGFVQAGIPAPPLPMQASNGNSGVIINGRNIDQLELIYLQALAQGVIYPGNYWLDAAGNAGAVGGPAQINFLQAAQAQQHNGAQQQGGGTSSWYGNGSAGWTDDSGGGGVWIANPYGGTGTTVTY